LAESPHVAPHLWASKVDGALLVLTGSNGGCTGRKGIPAQPLFSHTPWSGVMQAGCNYELIPTMGELH
jgi:hypothetical protein